MRTHTFDAEDGTMFAAKKIGPVEDVLWTTQARALPPKGDRAVPFTVGTLKKLVTISDFLGAVKDHFLLKKRPNRSQAKDEQWAVSPFLRPDTCWYARVDSDNGCDKACSRC